MRRYQRLNQPNQDDYSIEYLYSGERVYRELVDQKIDGQVDFAVTYSYEETEDYTNIYEYTEFFDENDQIERTSERWVVERFNVNGRLSSRETYAPSEEDLIIRATFFYNELQILERAEEYSQFSSTGEPGLSYEYIYRFDASGNQTFEERDRGIDGTIDKILIYNYDSSGNPESVVIDDGADGTYDEILYASIEAGECDDSVTLENFGYSNYCF